MRQLALLWEQLESRPDDADRVAALARYLRRVGREAGAAASEWLVALAGSRHARRPARVPLAELAEAAARVCEQAGMAPWLFDVGRAAEPETTEAIALLLPWPPAPHRPSFAQWQADWRAAAASEERAVALARMIARLDDAPTRRWAVRAACGLVRPLVDEWQWLRAWSAAFEEDRHALAWRWHALGRRRAMAVAAGDAAQAPCPHPFGAVDELAEDLAAPAALLDALRAGELWLEPQWAGLRVQLVRREGEVAVWQHDGALLNARLPAALLEPEPWPDPCAIEGVLIGWQSGRVVSPWIAAAGATPPRAKATVAPSASMHFVLTDWHLWDRDEAAHWTTHERRARLHARWPARFVEPEGAPPPIFTTPTLEAPPGFAPDAAGAAPPASPGPAASLHVEPAQALQALAAQRHAEGRGAWSGLLLRRRSARGPHERGTAWTVRAAPRRVRALLQYVPNEALGATAAPALAFVPCGFALWSRAPRSDGERDAAMAAALRGEVAVDAQGAGHDDALRLVPLARLPLLLPESQLQAIHAWLREHVGSRFGNVHAVVPALVFEIGFERLHASRRHRLGAVPEDARVLRWLPQAAAGEGDRVADLHEAAGGKPPGDRAA